MFHFEEFKDVCASNDNLCPFGLSNEQDGLYKVRIDGPGID